MVYSLKKGMVLFSLAATLVVGVLLTCREVNNNIDSENSKAASILTKYKNIIKDQRILSSRKGDAGQTSTLGLWSAPTGHLYVVAGEWTKESTSLTLCPIKPLSAQLFEVSTGNGIEFYRKHDSKLVKETLSGDKNYVQDIVVFGGYMGKKDAVKELHTQVTDPYFPAGRLTDTCAKTFRDLEQHVSQNATTLSFSKAGMN